MVFQKGEIGKIEDKRTFFNLRQIEEDMVCVEFKKSLRFLLFTFLEYLHVFILVVFSVTSL